MLGLFFNLWWNKIVPIEEMGMCAFNICIKNELIRRLRSAGIKKRPMIRTFDSFIYSIALSIGCPDLDKPNYEGRRKYVETWIRENDLSDPKVIHLLTQPFPHTIKWMFIDEAQDLEGRFYDVLRLVFPHANFIFFGDVFQCIQKEPRTCLLWHVLRPLPEDSTSKRRRHIFMMKKTPRVPPVILTEIRSALSVHYPEYTKLLSEWTSLNTKAVTEECKIHWTKFKNYKDVFQQSLDFIHEHGEDQVMILVFSSAITVRGGIGDVARFRHFYRKHGVKVNSNYKRLETDKLFLSTVNSSKGLERPHVFLILTFPLELAFANFSNDLVVNLVSVGLSRCKHQVVFSVPIYKDRHSRVLELYKDSPQPDSLLSTISRSKGQKEQFASLGPPGSLPEVLPTIPKNPASGEKRGYSAMGQNVAVFLEREHSTTEILRQSIVSYDTRLHCLSEYTRRVEYTKLFPGLDETFQNAWRASFSKLVTREEERALVGILMEQLMNTVWTRKWPSSLPQDVQNDDNPLFMHCKKDFVHEYRQYTQMTVTCSPDAASPDHKLQALYHYSRCHLMIFNKVCVSLSELVLSRIKEWFRKVSTGGLFKETISGVVEESNRGSLKLQHNLKMACMTGIADGFYIESGTVGVETGGTGTGAKRIGIIEIKGCPGSNWHEEALYQSFLYFLMANKSMGTIILLNPVRNEKLVFNVWIPRYYSVRISVFQEILLWNTNCFFAKYDGFYDDDTGRLDKVDDKPKDKTEDTTTLRTSSLEFPLILVVSVKDEENKTRGATVIRILATTKIDVLASAYSMTSSLEIPDNPAREDETATKRNRTKSEKLEDQSIQTPEAVEKMVEKTCRYFPEGSTMRIRVGFNGLKTEWVGGFDKIGVPARMKNRCVSEYLSQMSYESVLPTCPLDWQDHYVLTMMFAGFLRPFLC